MFEIQRINKSIFIPDLESIGDISKIKSEYIADFNKVIDEDAKLAREVYSKIKESIDAFLVS